MAVELPEARLLAGQMHDALAGKTIARVHLDRCDSLIRQGFVNLHQVDVTGLTVESVTWKGKWIYVKLYPDTALLFALETGGKLLFHRDEASLPARVHVRFDFADGTCLTEQIVGWGWARAVKKDELDSQRYPGKPGVSPIDEAAFTFEAFADVLDQSSGKALKKLLLEQECIAGIGNGYLHDILFKARVHPKRKAGDLDTQERVALYQAIQETLDEAIRLGGREGECDLYGTPGRYRPILDRRMKGEPCPACGTPIAKIAVLGSACYVCPSCQK